MKTENQVVVNNKENLDVDVDCEPAFYACCTKDSWGRKSYQIVDEEQFKKLNVDKLYDYKFCFNKKRADSVIQEWKDMY